MTADTLCFKLNPSYYCVIRGVTLASKKEKFLESAQRFVLKGQLDRAIKDYQQVVALDPKEIRHRQRLAELLVRDNRKEEAIVQYEGIGKHYAENSYFLKAIAIYKQIQRLSPGNMSVALTIASLNHQQGLIGNALAEYGLVVAQYEKEGAQKEALKVVEKMLGVDAEHVATRMKQAELLFATGSKDASLQVFVSLSGSLRAAGRDAEAEAVSRRMLQLFPDQQTTEPQRDELFLAEPPAASESQAPAPQAPAARERALETQPAAPEAFEEPGELELPDAFGEEPSLPEAAPRDEQPGAFDAPWEEELPAPAAAPQAAEATGPDLGSWEEEIELDLDDDLPGFEETTTPAPPQADLAAAPKIEIDLPLDFIEELELEEENAPAGPSAESADSAYELNLEQEESLELTLPHDAELFGEIEWSEEPAEPEEPEQGWSGASESDGAEPGWPEASEENGAEPEWLGDGEAVQGEVDLPTASPRGWDEIYPETAGQDDSALDFSELESHYDLGIGYKEMGMYAGAIKELDVAARNPQRRADCLVLQAVCYREKGEPEKGEELLRRGLALDVLSQDERLSLNYELAFSLESAGDVDEAIGLYREVCRVNPGFHDVGNRLAALAGEEPLDIIDLELEE